MEWLAMLWGVPKSRCIAAGDSGNDCDLLMAAGLGVLVANHSKDIAHLLSWPGIYAASKAHADGVLEGLDRVAPGGAPSMPDLLLTGVTS